MIAGTKNGKTDPLARANVECVEPSECERGDGCATDSTFFPATPCYEFEVSMVRI